METRTLPTEKVGWSSAMKNKWKSKSKLEQNLIIALVIITLILIATLLFIIIKHAVSPNICATPACLLAASQIVSYVDPLADPCEDFFQFACGNFIKNTGGISVTTLIDEKVQRQLYELIREPIKEDENQWIKHQKVYFKACMNKSATDEDSFDYFELTLDELNGWPVVVGYQWNENMFDWKNMIFHLKDKGYPYTMLLDVTTQRDPISKNRYIVSVSCPQVTKIQDEHKQLYKTYMADVAVLFGADRNQAVPEMQKVFAFQEALKNIYDDLYAKTKENKTLNQTALLLEGRMTVNQYQAINREIDWLNFINRILYPVGKLDGEDYVIFSNIESIASLFRLINQTSKRTIANYIIWTIIEQIKPFLSEKLRKLSDKYSCSTGGTPIAKYRSEFCKISVSERVMPISIIYARKYLPVDVRNKVKDIYTNVKLEVMSALEEASWMDNESKIKALEKAKATVDVIGAPGDYFNDAVFSRLFGDNCTDIPQDSFLTTILSLTKIKINLLYFKMHMNINDVELDNYYGYITIPTASYFEENVVVIPVSILQGIYYNVDRPMYMNYGAIGTVIGHELTHAFGEQRIDYIKDGDAIQTWTNATRRAFKEKTKCIIKEADEYTLKDAETEINGSATLEENLADYTGLKVSYAAYDKWTQRNGKEPLLPTLNYTPKQLFWISAVSHFCSMNSKKPKNDVHADDSFRTIAPLRNNPYFAHDFNCPVGSKMNPSEKCQVY